MPPGSPRLGQRGDKEARRRHTPDALARVAVVKLSLVPFFGRLAQRCQFGLFFSKQSGDPLPYRFVFLSTQLFTIVLDIQSRDTDPLVHSTSTHIQLRKNNAFDVGWQSS